MNQEQIPYDLIDKYLRGELAPEHEFVKQVFTDAVLAKEVELQKIITEAVVDNRLIQVKNVLERYKARDTEVVPNKSKWLLSCILIGMIGAAGLFLFSRETENKTKIEIPLIFKSLEKTNVPTSKNKIENFKKHASKKQGNTTSYHQNKTAYAVQPYNSSPKPVSAVLSGPIQKTTSKVLEEAELHQLTQKVAIQPSLSVVDKEAAIPVHPCRGISIKATVLAEKPCTASSEGVITLDNARGGVLPLSYSIDNGRHWQSDASFTNLKSGTYQLILRDATGCETLLNNDYVLTNKTCILIAESSFNPHLETWESPNKPEKAGELLILNRVGQVVYQKQFGRSEKLMWDGSGQNSETLLPGTFIYALKYNDGTTEQGRVTISY